MNKNVMSPCPDCPFSRTVKPGALGGSPPETFIGQAYGPFILPCHKTCNFSDPLWKDKTIDTPQCAGAAIFRANIGLNGQFPAVIHQLAPNKDKVFANAAEFYAHHKQISQFEACKQLLVTPPAMLLHRQMNRSTNRHWPVKS